jgi:large conductance mechanosensitive channel
MDIICKILVEDKLKPVFNEFKKFILRGNVVDLAVGIVIGASFTGVVNSFVRDIINPIIELFYHGGKFSSTFITIHGSRFQYGDFLNNLLTFLIVAAVVFFLVVQPINKLNELSARRKTTDEPTTQKCPYCLSTIPNNARRCKFCTAELTT